MAGVKDFLPQKVKLMESVQIRSVMTKKCFQEKFLLSFQCPCSPEIVGIELGMDCRAMY